MQIQPYLFYNGRCEEAIELYRAAVGAEVTMLMRFKDSPEPTSHGSEDKVMHASLRIGDSTLLVSDGRCSGQLSFEGFALSLVVANDAEAEQRFAALSNGGQVRDAAGQNVLQLEVRHGHRPFRRAVDDLCRGVKTGTGTAQRGLAGSQPLPWEEFAICGRDKHGLSDATALSVRAATLRRFTFDTLTCH